MEEANIIILTDDDGSEVEFEYIDSIEYAGAEYVFLLPAEDTDEGAEAVILKVDADFDDPELEQYVAEEDEEILTEVFELFKEKLKDEFNFED